MGHLSVLLIVFVSTLQTVLSDDPKVFVLVSDYGAIYRLEIHDFKVHRLSMNVTAPWAIDCDHQDGRIYFTEVFTRQIRRVDINGRNDEEVAAFNSSSSPEGITLDEETREVFYTDNGNNLIGKVNMDTLTHIVIVNTGLDRPRGIVADTKNKNLYWVDFGDSEKIETSDYYGGKRAVVLSLGIAIPLGITLDEKDGRLYWTDAFHENIESVRVDGTDRQEVLSHSNRSLSMISFYNDFLYYTDFEDISIFIHPLNTKEYMKLDYYRLLRPRGLHVFSPNFQIKERCPNGRYGKNCVPCGSCEEYFLCEKTRGVCLHGCEPGYTTLYCNQSQSLSYPTASTDPNPSPSSGQTSSKRTPWTIIYVCIAVFCVLVLGIILYVWFCKSRRRNNRGSRGVVHQHPQPVYNVSGYIHSTNQPIPGNPQSGQAGNSLSSTTDIMNPLYEAEPPTYWSVFGAEGAERVKTVECPPSYQDMMAEKAVKE